MRLIVVSNRLPISLKKKNHEWTVVQGNGGLVTALNPILKKHQGTWIGWLGTNEAEDFSPVLERAEKKLGYSVRPVTLTQKEVDLYYIGYSNEILWPLFHSLETRCNFKPEYWKAYLDVNRKFSDVIIKNTTSSDFIWVHDYHLMQVAYNLRKKDKRRKTGFFLHIPFPSPDIFLKLPWRTEILQGLLEFDLIGVHTANDARNLIEAIRRIRPIESTIEETATHTKVTIKGHTVKIGVFPISIDFEAFSSLALNEKVVERSWRLRQEFPKQKIILSIDRLDYTKGIPERIEAFRNALQRYPKMHGQISLVQIVVPSRIEVAEYEKLKTEIECLIGETNGQFGFPGWTPIHYYYRSFPHEKLAAYYRAADIALISSLRDGMNLVAKEYVACNIEESGVLILSEFAGAAAELHKGAILINPYDIEASADAIYRAFMMPEEERRRRMHLMRRTIQNHDIHHWLEAFLQAAKTDTPSFIIEAEEFLPTINVSNSSL